MSKQSAPGYAPFRVPLAAYTGSTRSVNDERDVAIEVRLTPQVEPAPAGITPEQPPDESRPMETGLAQPSNAAGEDES